MLRGLSRAACIRANVRARVGPRRWETHSYLAQPTRGWGLATNRWRLRLNRGYLSLHGHVAGARTQDEHLIMKPSRLSIVGMCSRTVRVLLEVIQGSRRLGHQSDTKVK